MAECNLLSVREQLELENLNLKKQVRQLKEDIEQGFMKGAYARLKELQETERRWLKKQ